MHTTKRAVDGARASEAEVWFTPSLGTPHVGVSSVGGDVDLSYFATCMHTHVRGWLTRITTWHS